MQSVIFGAGLPNELKLQRAPIAKSEGDRVTITLAIFAAEAENQTAYLDLVLEPEYAEHLAVGLTAAVRDLKR